MTDKKEAKNENQGQPPKVLVNGQYIKDLSFENPNAPQSLANIKKAPKISVNVDVNAKKLENNTFEVTLHINANAKNDEESLFVVELIYAGIFTLQIPEQEFEPALLIYAPNMLFPFARQIIGEATRQGGFPPLYIDPIDFTALYRKHKTSGKKDS